MGITVESAKARVKTGKSCAIRCAHCGEATIADHFVNQVMSSTKYNGMEVSSSLSEKSEAVYCRLCGAVHKVPPSATPITWEEFDFALASDDLIDRTNPGVRDLEPPPVNVGPKGVSRPVASLLEYLRNNRNTKELLPVPTIIFGVGLVVTFVGGNAVKSATGSLAVGIAAGILIATVSVVAGIIVNFRQTLDVLADKHGPFVCRFLNEMDMELKQLIDACTTMGSKYAKVSAILGRIPEYYDV